MNNSNKELDALVACLKQYDWFCEAKIEYHNKFIVYVTKMDLDFIRKIPDMIENYHVLFHFNTSKFLLKKEEINLQQELIIDEDDFSLTDLGSLVKELARLKKNCGSNILEDIFFECHDQKNAITNLSSVYPDVRKSMEELYDEFGFDIIYDEFE